MSRKIKTLEELKSIIKELGDTHHIMWAIKKVVSDRDRTIMYSGSEEEFENREELSKALWNKLVEEYKPNFEILKYDSMYINRMRHKFKYFKNRFISKLDNKTY